MSTQGLLQAQVEGEDTEAEQVYIDTTNEIFSKTLLDFYLDDVMILVGGNYSNQYMSQEHKRLSASQGIRLGLEIYESVRKNAFLNVGMHYSQRGFVHRESISFQRHHLELPILLSYELPVLRDYDFRFFLGSQFSYLLSSTQQGNYDDLGLAETDFKFDKNRFNRFDYGFCAGISGEYRSFYARVKTYLGFVRTDAHDNSSTNTFSVEFGYFIFREL